VRVCVCVCVCTAEGTLSLSLALSWSLSRSLSLSRARGSAGLLLLERRRFVGSRSCEGRHLLATGFSKYSQGTQGYSRGTPGVLPGYSRAPVRADTCLCRVCVRRRVWRSIPLLLYELLFAAYSSTYIYIYIYKSGAGAGWADESLLPAAYNALRIC
jgi:hypothetical protein